MFLIYKGRIKDAETPYFIWRENGRYLLFLRGVNVFNDAVEAIYQPVLTVIKMTGMIGIETPWHIILLFKRPPFIYAERLLEHQLTWR